MNKWRVIIILGISQFVMILDSTVMNVSISTVAHELGTTISGMQAAITLYALTMAAFMLTGGKVGDIWGRHKAFTIGSIIYGIGSLITALSPNLPTLLFGWSLVEGLGAVLVIPAIASLAASNYKGRDRIAAFSILGAATGIAAAFGPLIGGLMTTYFSWRYVFVAETIIMIGVLLSAKVIRDETVKHKPRLDIPSVILSAGGMTLLVLGVLQSKTWGWIAPLNPPVINGIAFAPFGISPTAYFILFGIVILWWFWHRQKALEAAKKTPLLKVSLLSLKALRGGLATFFSQYFTIAALFFVIPVYLQTILGYDALQTGIKLVPLSIGLVLFSVVGSRLATIRSARYISRWGQAAMALGLLLLIAAIDPQLNSTIFWIGMFTIGVGFGLLASQLGNVNMSAVDKKDTAEVGGLQGTFQNLGTSFGTAIAGSVFILTLTSGFMSSIQSSSSLSAEAKDAIINKTESGLQIVTEQQAQSYIKAHGGSEQTSIVVAQTYQDAQLEALRASMFIVFALSIFALLLSRNLPAKIT